MLLGVGLSACGGQAPTPAGQSASLAPSARQLLRQAMQDARIRGSVHEVERDTAGRLAAALSDDVATSRGRQTITLTTGAIAHVVVIGKTAYIAGNATAVRHFFDFSTSAADTIGRRWLSIPSTSRAYATVVQDATLPSVLNDLQFRGGLTELTPSTIDGQSVIGIEGTAFTPGKAQGHVTGIVYISRSTHPLPVAATYSAGNAATTTVAFDHWGERLSVHPPAPVITEHALDAQVTATNHATAAKTSGSDGSTTAEDALAGYWTATGRVVAAHNSAIEVVGETIQRLWLIHRACATKTCPWELERQVAGATTDTLGTPITAPLIPTATGWRAPFTQANVYCQGLTADYPGTEHSQFQLTQAPDGTITADEQTRTSGPDCETGTTTVIWTAHRLPSQSTQA
jgi:hypothetical protein